MIFLFERIDHLPVTRVIGDVRDRESLQKGMHGCDGMIHLAGLSNWNDIQSKLMEEVVVQGSLNVLHAAQQAGNIRTVFVSSMTAVNGTDQPGLQDEQSPFSLPAVKAYAYAHAKKRVEAYCGQMHQQGLPIVIVNPAEMDRMIWTR